MNKLALLTVFLFPLTASAEWICVSPGPCFEDTGDVYLKKAIEASDMTCQCGPGVTVRVITVPPKTTILTEQEQCVAVCAAQVESPQ